MRLKPEAIVAMVDYCIRRGTYPGHIDNVLARPQPGGEPLTHFTDIDYAVESLFLPCVHRDAREARQDLACLLCGFHPKNHYFMNIGTTRDGLSFNPARWPDGRHDGPPHEGAADSWPKQDDPRIDKARSPAICILCVERNWKQDDERIRGAIVAVRKKADVYLDAEEAALDIEERFPHRVVGILPHGTCSFCRTEATELIKGAAVTVCPGCFSAIKRAAKRLFLRLETESRMLGPWED